MKMCICTSNQTLFSFHLHWLKTLARRQCQLITSPTANAIKNINSLSHTTVFFPLLFVRCVSFEVSQSASPERTHKRSVCSRSAHNHKPSFVPLKSPPSPCRSIKRAVCYILSRCACVPTWPPPRGSWSGISIYGMAEGSALVVVSWWKHRAHELRVCCVLITCRRYVYAKWLFLYVCMCLCVKPGILLPINTHEAHPFRGPINRPHAHTTFSPR